MDINYIKHEFIEIKLSLNKVKQMQKKILL